MKQKWLLCKFLKKIWPEQGPLKRFLWFFFIYSVFVCICAYWMGFGEDPLYPPSETHLRLIGSDKVFIESDKVPEYRSYFDKMNWVLFPVFIIIVGGVVKFTWEPFQRAWQQSGSDPESVVRRSCDGRVIQPKDASKLTQKLERIRNRWLLVLAGGFALIFAILDYYETFTIYFGKVNYLTQMEFALIDPDFDVKWLFEQPVKSLQSARIPPPCKQIIFNWILELEEFLLIGLGFLVLFQILLQTICFAALDQFPLNGVRYSIQLDPKRPANDFGLENWNKALDIASWAIAPGLCITIISMLSQPAGSKDIGQNMGIISLGLLFASLLLPTIAGRRRWVYECQSRLAGKDISKRTWERFHEQKPWPMNFRRMENIGLIVSIYLFTVYAGIEISTFLIRFIMRSPIP